MFVLVFVQRRRLPKNVPVVATAAEGRVEATTATVVGRSPVAKVPAEAIAIVNPEATVTVAIVMAAVVMAAVIPVVVVMAAVVTPVVAVMAAVIQAVATAEVVPVAVTPVAIVMAVIVTVAVTPVVVVMAVVVMAAVIPVAAIRIVAALQRLELLLALPLLVALPPPEAEVRSRRTNRAAPLVTIQAAVTTATTIAVRAVETIDEVAVIVAEMDRPDLAAPEKRTAKWKTNTPLRNSRTWWSTLSAAWLRSSRATPLWRPMMMATPSLRMLWATTSA